MIEVKDTDFPESFQDADAESKEAQKTYVGVFTFLLIATAAGAVGTWVSTDFEPYRMTGSILAAVMLVVAFALTVDLSSKNYEQRWYAGRAIAESIKSRTWSYMMRGERYPSGISEIELDRRFVLDLGDILKEKGPLVLSKASTSSAPEVSKTMRLVRSMSVSDRLQTYVECRVRDQQSWYKAKARGSSENQGRLFLLIQVTQVLSFLIVGYSLYQRQVTSGSVGVLAAGIASVLAWLQMRKYQETAQSYSIAHLELNLIEALSSSVSDDASLAQFVQDAENAISREHTLWVAKRVMR